MSGVLVSFVQYLDSFSNAGLIYMFIQGLFFSISQLFVKMIDMNSFQIVFYRNLLLYLFTIQSMKFFSIKDNTMNDHKGYNFYQGIIGCIGLSLFFMAIQMINISEAITLMFMSPVWTGILAYFLLGEPYTKIDILSSIFSLFGCVMILKPSFLFPNQGEQSPMLGKLIALAGSFMQALVYITIREIKGRSNVYETTSYFGIVATLTSPFGIMLQGTKGGDWQDYCLLFLLGFTSFLGQITMNKGIQMVRPGKGAILNYLQIVYSYIFSIFVLGEHIDSLAVLGSLLICLNAAFIFYKNMTEQQPKPKQLENLKYSTI